MDEANSLYFSGDLDQALKICLRILRANNVYPDANRLAGDIYADTGKRDQAIAEYRELLRAQPNNRVVQEKIRRLQAAKAAPKKSPSNGARSSPSPPVEEKKSIFQRIIGGGK